MPKSSNSKSLNTSDSSEKLLKYIDLSFGKLEDGKIKLRSAVPGKRISALNATDFNNKIINKLQMDINSLLTIKNGKTISSEADANNFVAFDTNTFEFLENGDTIISLCEPQTSKKPDPSTIRKLEAETTLKEILCELQIQNASFIGNVIVINKTPISIPVKKNGVLNRGRPFIKKLIQKRLEAVEFSRPINNETVISPKVQVQEATLHHNFTFTPVKSLK